MEDCMIKLKPAFQKEIFTKFINKYHGSINAASFIKIPASSIRGYKNLYFDSVPKKIIDMIYSQEIFSKKDLESNTLEVTQKKDIIKKSLLPGRLKRTKILNQLKSKIPPIEEIMHPNYLDLSKWFVSYLPLLNSGFRNVTFVDNEDYLELSYTNYNGLENKRFNVKLPKRIILNAEFIYFLGLWCGDRSGGKRFGICNQSPEILNFSEAFLKKYFQETKRVLYTHSNVPLPPIPFDKKVIINKGSNGWSISVFSSNGVICSFFDYLLNNLEFLLTNILQREIFFAGLFDAEGNVSIYNKSFRWACKDEVRVKIYSKFLKEMDLFDGYDGGCLISYNLSNFRDKILPYLIHKERSNLATFLIDGLGDMPASYLKILKYIKNMPSCTNLEISKALKKNKVYSELKILSDFGFIYPDGYPFKYKLTSKGLKSLGD